MRSNFRLIWLWPGNFDLIIVDIGDITSVIRQKGEFSKRVLQENKARQVFRKANTS